MIKVVALILSFADGWQGGHVTASYFWEPARCQEEGSKLAMQYTGYGHPTSFVCAPTQLEDRFAKLVRA